MHTDAKSLCENGDRLFSLKAPIDRRNQEIAEQFYPERADFTVTRDIGENFADHLFTGYPSMVRRDLGNSFGTMLRPRAQDWFHLRLDREDKEDHDAKVWMEWASGVQRRAMYDRKSRFAEATKQGDHDFASFGGCVISTEVNRRDTSLLYRNWHLRDVAWQLDSYGERNETYRNWFPTAKDLCAHFPDKVHDKVKKAKDKDPYGKIKVRHSVIESDAYMDGKFAKYPYVSVYLDVENKSILEERGSWTRIYDIPLWATTSGSQYPYSPATVIALPDARLIQSMTLTLLEAGELAVRPPTIGVAEAIRGDLQLYPGGFTSVDAEYDERLGEVLRPLTQDKSGLGFGVELSDRVNAMIKEAFYLNTLTLPDTGGAMTAYETGQRVQEYVRNALPLFEPMEQNYNGAICETTFETLLREGAFGSPDTMPDSLSSAKVRFAFESPLAEMVEKQKGQKFLEAQAMVAQAAQVDESATNVLNIGEALRDVISGIGAPQKWLRSEEQVAEKANADAEAQQAAQMLQSMDSAAGVAQKLGQASESFGGIQ